MTDPITDVTVDYIAGLRNENKLLVSELDDRKLQDHEKYARSVKIQINKREIKEFEKSNIKLAWSNDA